MSLPIIPTGSRHIDFAKIEDAGELSEKLIRLKRVSKVARGGRRFSFNALVVIGDRNGYVGMGHGKANEVPEAIRKGIDAAKKGLVKIKMTKSRTLPHSIYGIFKRGRVLLQPAAPGTGVIAGGSIRAVCEYAGLHDVIAKSLGSRNSLNTAKATFDGLNNIRSFKEEAAYRGRSIQDLWK